MPRQIRRRRSQSPRAKPEDDLTEIKHHYEVLGRSKIALLLHVTSQHSVLDTLYGSTGGPLPSWTFQTTPEVAVSDQQHTGRCWIFATLAVLGHVFRSQHGITNHRASFSEGYLGFWDLYEKSRLFLQVAYDTRQLPLNDPSLCDLLKNGISDGGDYIFCLNLLDRYGIVPTEYYPNSTYGSMSTEALVTLLNEVLRDNVITLRRTGDATLIKPMLTNVFSLLSFGLGLPPMPWKKLNWQLDQAETMAHYAGELDAPSDSVDAFAELFAAAEVAPPTTEAIDQVMTPSRPPAPGWSTPASAQRAPLPAPVVAASTLPVAVSSQQPPRATYPVTVPPPMPTPAPIIPPEPVVSPPAPAASAAMADLVASLEGPPSPTQSVMSNATAAPVEEIPVPSDLADDIASSAVIVDDGEAAAAELQLSGSRPPKRIVDVPTRGSSTCAAINASKCARQPGALTRLVRRLTPAGCGGPNSDVPAEGSGAFFSEAMGDEGGCLRGRKTPCGDTGSLCRLSHTLKKSTQSEPPREDGEALVFDYTPREFYRRFMTGVRFIPVVCDARFPSGTRIISNDANMFGGLPSLYLNITIDDIEDYAIASLKRNIPVWFACDVKKQLSPEGGRMCTENDRLTGILPEEHLRGTKLEEICHFNAIANHALLITAVSMNEGKPVAWRIVNSWGDVGRLSGVFVATGKWFRQHVYSINAVYDTMSKSHRADVDNKQQSRRTVRLGPFDPSVI